MPIASSLRKRAPASAVFAVFVVLLSAGFALGYYSQLVNWYIPAMNGSHYVGYACGSGKEMPGYPTDYTYCEGAEVSQSSAGSFSWYQATGLNGVENGEPSWWGDVIVWDQASGALFTSSALYCTRIYNNWSMSFFRTNTSSNGTLQVTTGAGDVGCGMSYLNDLYLGVIGY